MPRTGILSVLDDACASVGNVTDEVGISERTRQELQSHQHYTSRGLKQSEKSIKFDEFRVTHYAGDVTYSVNGFMDKNRDTLFQDLKRLLFKQVRKVFDFLLAFIFHVDILVAQLASKEPHYIRCIKPMRKEQYYLTWSGWSIRCAIWDCSRMYAFDELVLSIGAATIALSTGTSYSVQTLLANPRGISGVIIVPNLKLHWDARSIAFIVKQQVFIRSPQTVFRLEELRSEKLPTVVIYLQKMLRGALARRRYKQTKAVYKIMATYKRYKLRSYMIHVIELFR
ncbi:hypothetical protein OSTOST_13792 [Ostertagia ostertagi]